MGANKISRFTSKFEIVVSRHNRHTMFFMLDLPNGVVLVCVQSDYI